MSERFIIEPVKQLQPFLNDEKFLELVERGKNKKIAAIHKVYFNEISEAQEKAFSQMIQELNKNSLMNEKNLKLLGQVAKSQKIGLLLGGMNLCATCAGFAIMYEKLDKMSAQLGEQINQLKKIMKQEQDLQTGFEWNKVLSLYMDMIDCRKKQKPFTEEKMRDLVDREYNVLDLLIKIIEADISEDSQTTLFSAFSMLSMFTVSLRYFDEIYYVNNHTVLEGKDVWHTSHQKWMAIYDKIASQSFIEKIQDYAIFKAGMDTQSADVYYMELMDQVVSEKEDIIDNQELIVRLGSSALLQELQKMCDMEVRSAVKTSLNQAYGDILPDDIQKIYTDVMEQMASA